MPFLLSTENNRWEKSIPKYCYISFEDEFLDLKQLWCPRVCKDAENICLKSALCVKTLLKSQREGLVDSLSSMNVFSTPRTKSSVMWWEYQTWGSCSPELVLSLCLFFSFKWGSRRERSGLMGSPAFDEQNLNVSSLTFVFVFKWHQWWDLRGIISTGILKNDVYDFIMMFKMKAFLLLGLKTDE